MITKEHGDIVIFHYRKIEKSQENRKIWRRGVEAIIVTPQSIQEAGKTIPTLVVTGFSSGIVDHSSNQLSLAPQTANSGNLNIQENVESAAGCFSDVVDHSSNQLPLPSQTANTSNLNIQENVESAAGCSSCIADHSSNQLPLPPQTASTSNLNIQENVESAAGCSPDIVDHSSNQLPLPPQTATTSNLNIQENVESADSQQDTDAEFPSSYNSNSFTEVDMLHRDSEIENQSIPQETNNDFLPNLAIPGSLTERMEYTKRSSEKNKKNPKRGIEILGEHPANRFGEVHMSYQQNPELQKGWNNGKRCKMTNTSNLRNIKASAASGGCVPFEVTEKDFPPKPGIPVMPCELLELFPEFSFPEDSGNYIGDYPSGSIFESLLLPDECLISVMPFEWPEIDNSELFPEFSFPEDLGNYIGDYPSGSIFEKSPSPG
ncbi:uncharacterized protein LOC123192751 [Mangifera indica]|uniref:uncharacterized protein LOC123192751 n=1 Tax=Mangifera indica TaxID=29780 RepID=UPI001CFC22A5|nr:uncharacterized protein LOC123192751 [Mangifera indica]